MSDELTPLVPSPLPEMDKASHLADMASELVELNGLQMSAEMLALMERGLHSVKLPRALRNQKAAESFQDAFELIGGTARLALWADKNPDKFYQIFGKQMAPTMAPVLATIPSAKKDESGQWPAWLEARRLAYQERDQVVDDINVKEIGKD
jgi:hypothetical protein